MSGLMILFAVLLFGMTFAIPASRAIQEAEMRDRIAGIAVADEDDSETDSESTNRADPPPLTEVDEESDDEAGEPAPPPIEEVGRSKDLASLRSSVNVGSSELAEEEEPDKEPREAKTPRKPAPAHIRIPSVNIDAEVHQVGYEVHEVDGQRVREWEVASYAAGHHKTSARPGEGGNIVVTGHNDWEGEVFRTLEYIEHGQEVVITTEEGEHRYVVAEIHMRREIGATLEERLETGRFMAEMPEERLTLITCWPYGINDHRVIVIALPVES
jgi:LPXTG-site transpeptidase (sortase) family protein